MDLVRMRPRKSGGERKEKEDERVATSGCERRNQARLRPIWESKKEEKLIRSGLSKGSCGRKRKSERVAGDRRRQMVLDKAEKRSQDEKQARILADEAEKKNNNQRR